MAMHDGCSVRDSGSQGSALKDARAAHLYSALRRLVAISEGTIPGSDQPCAAGVGGVSGFKYETTEQFEISALGRAAIVRGC
jgi:hypothetical protein